MKCLPGQRDKVVRKLHRAGVFLQRLPLRNQLFALCPGLLAPHVKRHHLADPWGRLGGFDGLLRRDVRRTVRRAGKPHLWHVGTRLNDGRRFALLRPTTGLAVLTAFRRAVLAARYLRIGPGLRPAGRAKNIKNSRSTTSTAAHSSAERARHSRRVFRKGVFARIDDIEQAVARRPLRAAKGGRTR